MKKPVIFISMNRFGFACLAELLQQGKPIDLIVTLDSTATTGITDYQDLTPLAERFKIPIRYVKHIRDITNELIAMQPQLLLVLGWSQLIEQRLIDAAERGCVGSHPSLLPKNRGRAAIAWHFINEEKFGGLTFFFIQAGLDDGPIIAQAKFTLTDQDNASSYYGRLLKIGPSLLCKHFDQITEGTVKVKKQNENLATYLLIRRAQHSQLHFTQLSRQLINVVRAVTNVYPLAFFTYRQQTYTTQQVTQPVSAPRYSGFPGQIAKVFPERLWVVTGDGLVELSHVELDRQPIADLSTIFREGTSLNE